MTSNQNKQGTFPSVIDRKVPYGELENTSRSAIVFSKMLADAYASVAEFVRLSSVGGGCTEGSILGLRLVRFLDR